MGQNRQKHLVQSRYWRKCYFSFCPWSKLSTVQKDPWTKESWGFIEPCIETHHYLEHCCGGPRDRGQPPHRVVPVGSSGERRWWNIAAFSVCVAYKSEVTFITMKTATQTHPWYQPAMRGRRADLNDQNEYALVFLVRKCHMPRSSSHPDLVSTPSVLSFLIMRWLSLRRHPILLSLAYR